MHLYRSSQSSITLQASPATAEIATLHRQNAITKLLRSIRAASIPTTLQAGLCDSRSVFARVCILVRAVGRSHYQVCHFPVALHRAAYANHRVRLTLVLVVRVAFAVCSKQQRRRRMPAVLNESVRVRVRGDDTRGALVMSA